MTQTQEIVKALTDKELLEAFVGKVDLYKTFIEAVVEGDKDLVEALIPFVNPQTDGSEALSIASGNGHIEIVKLLLPRSNPKARDSNAFKIAACNRRGDVMDILAPLSDPKVVEDWGDNFT